MLTILHCCPECLQIYSGTKQHSFCLKRYALKMFWNCFNGYSVVDFWNVDYVITKMEELKSQPDELQGDISDNLSIEQLKLLAEPERILFLIDAHPEMNSPWDQTSIKCRMQIVKECKIRTNYSFNLFLFSFWCTAVINIIVQFKSNTKFKHKFAIAKFTSSSDLVFLTKDFTSSKDEIEDYLVSLAPLDNYSSTSELDLSQLLLNLQTEIKFDQDFPLTRCILIFGRSKEVLKRYLPLIRSYRFWSRFFKLDRFRYFQVQMKYEFSRTTTFSSTPYTFTIKIMILR